MNRALRHFDPDRAYDDLRQREVDAEQEGLRAGRLGLGAGLSSDLYGRELAAFTRGFITGASERAVADDRKRARRVCLGCTCNGVGQCIGDAQ